MALAESSAADDRLSGPAGSAWTPDPVGDAVAEGTAGGGRREQPLRHALAEAQELLAQARRDGAYRASQSRALALVRSHPSVEDLQVVAARLLMEDGDSRALTCWRGVQQRFPAAWEPFRMLLRTTRREMGEAAAEALFADRFPRPEAVTGEKGLLGLAFAFEEMGRLAEAEAAFLKTAHIFPQSRVAWRRLIYLQEARGGLISAQGSAAEAMVKCGGEVFVQAHARLTRELQILESFAPGAGEGEALSVKALEAIVAGVIEKRRHVRRASAAHLGGTLMITGSLGSGGAERQLVASVLALHAAIGEGQPVAGWPVAGPVTVACRSLSTKQDNHFFLDALTAAGVTVTEYGRLPAFGGDKRLSRVAPFQTIMDFLPPRMKEGLTRLVELIRFQAPDVVHIWQDGMVFAAGLAALVAEAPRIVLSVRTLPPIDRVSRWRVELEPVYRALLSAPGVILTANSAHVARRYEAWLGLAKGMVPVIQNGVERLPEQPEPGDEAAWAEFTQRTAGADFTLGAVMRLDQNKRPMEWLAMADRLHRVHPGARFIIVGDGALREETLDYARRLGLSDRVLFTGRSLCVGYWLTRMDALALLSRYEGMPNVLIEAQLAGRPVLTTPAGGAAETLVDGETGYVLASAENPDLDEAVARLRQLIALGPDGRRRMGEAARTWAEQAFSKEAMLARTVDLFMSVDDEPMLAIGSVNRA